jgi:hypothetical protein
LFLRGSLARYCFEVTSSRPRQSAGTDEATPKALRKITLRQGTVVSAKSTGRTVGSAGDELPDLQALRLSREARAQALGKPNHKNCSE